MCKRLLNCFLFGSLLQVARPGHAAKSRVENHPSAALPDVLLEGLSLREGAHLC